MPPVAVAVAAGLLLVGCRSGEPPAAAPELTGTFTVGGAAARLLGCRPGHAVHVFVDIDTSLGTLRFGEGKLRWDGTELVCEKLDRSWGGGVRNDGSSYFRGTLAFRCGKLAGDLALDCGRISPAERGELDRNGAAARKASGGSSAGPISTTDAGAGSADSSTAARPPGDRQP